MNKHVVNLLFDYYLFSFVNFLLFCLFLWLVLFCLSVYLFVLFLYVLCVGWLVWVISSQPVIFQPKRCLSLMT